jgi:hypothetical protein
MPTTSNPELLLATDDLDGTLSGEFLSRLDLDRRI